MASYYPEMNEAKPQGKLFDTRHNFGSSYSVQWPTERDAEARAFFKANRIRPLANGRTADGITYDRPEDRYDHRAVGRCLVSYGSLCKINAADVNAHEVLLD